jgi:hypothetical protein
MAKACIASVSQRVNWLERANVQALIDEVQPLEAWKLKNSTVYNVYSLTGRIVTKGTHVDWPPLNGKIY